MMLSSTFGYSLQVLDCDVQPFGSLNLVKSVLCFASECSTYTAAALCTHTYTHASVHPHVVVYAHVVAHMMMP